MNAAAVVGPNAILQTAAALEAQGGRALAARVFDAAGLALRLDDPPCEMVPQGEAAALLCALHATLAPETARRVAGEAGRRTGEYILAHRIPGPVQFMLRIMPARFAGPALMGAVARHAWTFAGSGTVSCEMRPRVALVIGDNPLAVDGCDWHCAVFETLFRRLVHPRARVDHPMCCARGNGLCRFEVDTGG